jgi:hypothetical protein
MFSVHCSNALSYISVDHRFSLLRSDALSYISVDQRSAIHRSNAALMQSDREIEIRTVTGGLHNEKRRMYFSECVCWKSHVLVKPHS